MLRVKLNYLDQWTTARQRNAAIYRRLLAEAGLLVQTEAKLDHGVMVHLETGNGRHIYNQLVIRSGQRDALKAYLQQRDIGTEVYYPVPLHLQECFADLGYRPGDLSVSEQAAQQTLALPIYPELTVDMQMAVVTAIANYYSL